MREGAKVIAFDVHFIEARSSEDDQLFAKAISKAGSVVLCEPPKAKEVPFSNKGSSYGDVHSIVKIVKPLVLFSDPAAATAPFVLPRIPFKVNQYWTFKTGAGDSPTLPVVVFQLFTLEEYDEFIHLLKKVAPNQAQKLPHDRDAVIKKGNVKGLIREKKMRVAEFKAKHAANLDKLIDPDHPDFGPKNNQMAFIWGRLKAGRGDLISRFTRDAFGSTNAHGHTTVCQGSLYFTYKPMADQFVEGKFTGGPKFYWQADAQNSEFIIFVGASPLEGNYGPTHRSKALTEGITDGRLKFAVVDPRHSKTASKAWKWVPVKPGTDGALALGLIRWILENGYYNGAYLRNANRGAAAADKEGSRSCVPMHPRP